MPYPPYDWKDKPDLSTPITQARLDIIENALAAATALAESHPATTISDSTAIGRSILTALNGAAVRGLIGAGTGSSNLVLGTTAGTAKEGNYQPAAADIIGSTPAGRAVLLATDNAAIRALLSLPPTTPVTAARQTLPAANTYIVGRSIPAGALALGSRFRITLNFSNPATASTSTIAVKYGTAGSVADSSIHTVTFTGTAAADVATVVIDVQVDSISIGTGAMPVSRVLSRNLGSTATGFHNVAGNSVSTAQATTLDTTAARTLGVSVQESAATTVLLNALIEQIK
jgi:hypothetical protein